jgi:hypothetical protein
VVTILVQPIVTAVIYMEVWRQAVHFSLGVLTLLNDSLKRAAFGHRDSEDAAKALFSGQLLKRVTSLYRVRPNVEFVQIASLVENREEL